MYMYLWVKANVFLILFRFDIFEKNALLSPETGFERKILLSPYPPPLCPFLMCIVCTYMYMYLCTCIFKLITIVLAAILLKYFYT